MEHSLHVSGRMTAVLKVLHALPKEVFYLVDTLTFI